MPLLLTLKEQPWRPVTFETFHQNDVEALPNQHFYKLGWVMSHEWLVMNYGWWVMSTQRNTQRTCRSAPTSLGRANAFFKFILLCVNHHKITVWCSVGGWSVRGTGFLTKSSVGHLRRSNSQTRPWSTFVELLFSFWIVTIFNRRKLMMPKWKKTKSGFAILCVVH